jgi:hypothetical protein
MDALEHLFEDTRGRLIDLVHFAGPWALPAVGAFAVLLAVIKRDRIVSPAGVITILAIAAFAVVVRAIQLGAF